MPNYYLFLEDHEQRGRKANSGPVARYLTVLLIVLSRNQTLMFVSNIRA